MSLLTARLSRLGTLWRPFTPTGPASSGPVVVNPSPPASSGTVPAARLSRLGTLWRPFTPTGPGSLAAPVAALPFLFDVELRAWLLAAGIPAYPLYRPQAIPLPTTTFTMLDESEFDGLYGVADVVAAKYQFSVWSKSYPQALGMAKALADQLRGYRGPIGRASVQRVFLGPLQSVGDPAADGGGKGVIHLAREVRISYRRSPVGDPGYGSSV